MVCTFPPLCVYAYIRLNFFLHFYFFKKKFSRIVLSLILGTLYSLFSGAPAMQESGLGNGSNFRSTFVSIGRLFLSLWQATCHTLKSKLKKMAHTREDFYLQNEEYVISWQPLSSIRVQSPAGSLSNGSEGHCS